MKRNFAIFISAFICTATITSGCGSGVTGDQIQPIENTTETLENTSIIETEAEEKTTEELIIEESPNIIIDRIGYRQFCRKSVYILGENIHSSFDVIDEKTGKTVYTGTLKLTDDKGYDGKKLYYGEFTDYELKGEFRIYQEEIGYSPLFSIDPDRYKNEFREIYRILEDTNYENVSDWLYVLGNLLLTKDMYSETYVDSDYIETSIETLMELQNPDSGAIVENIPGEDEMPDAELAAQYAGTLAQYNILFREANPELAQKCLESAVRAYSYMERNTDDLNSDIFYYAASELYRATGQYGYRSAIERYDSLENSKSYSDYNYLFTADVTYLKTNYRTDYERCQTIMKHYQGAAESISDKIDKAHFFVQKDITKLADNQILNNMQKVGLVSYVVSGYEYSGILENYVHYLDGLNTNSEYVLINNREYPESINEQDVIELSKLLFSIGHLYNS